MSQRILVLCTGNSCRSIMAEALINRLAAGRWRAVSAGSRPTGVVHPKTLETLRRNGVDTGGLRSKSWDEFAGSTFDMVITVCDSAAAESCPVFPGAPKKLHWGIPDPAAATGTEEEKGKAFQNAFELLRARVENELSRTLLGRSRLDDS